MAQPTPYDRQSSFSNIQAQAPSDPLPGNLVDAEFNAVKETTDEVLANLALIQRDDGALANGSVGLEQLSEEIEIGWQAPEVWVTDTAYVSGNTVFNGSAFYRLLVAHTSGTFATDLAAGKWEEIVDLSDLTIVAASQIANTPSGSIAATTVQAAIDELASEKAALSHTHPASAISDSTGPGRTLLTAANVEAQRTALELGDLALLDTIPVTDINAQIALSGIIEPAALSADVNDWTPTGIATCSTIRMSASTTGVDITGILAPAADGSLLVLENVGDTYPITLLPSNAASAATNRFLFPAPVVIAPNSAAVIKYDKDGTAPRWRLLHAVGSLPAGGFRKLSVNWNTNAGCDITADAITLENSAGDTYRALAVNVTVDTLDTGSLANATEYHAWLFFNPSTNVLVGRTSASATAPTAPAGYTFKVRVGANFTNGSAQFYRVLQRGRIARYVIGTNPTAPRTLFSAANTGYTAQSVSAFVPSTAVSMMFAAFNSTNISNWAIAPNGSYSFAGGATPPQFQVTNAVSSALSLDGTLPLESTNVYQYSSAGTMTAYVYGWEDNL